MGLEGESAYPYTAKDGSCHDSKSQEQAFITAWQQISTDETQIAAALQQYGPLSIGINANTLQFYTGGVSNPSKILCNPAAWITVLPSLVSEALTARTTGPFVTV